MSLVINNNAAATQAASNLASSSQLLQRSLNRLSSGSKINSPADDAGGLAVAMKLSAAIHRHGAVLNNVANAQSFLQTQDGVLSVAGKVLTRMGELKTLYLDPTKNSTDKANYDVEFTQLQAEITSLANEKFNGVSLFGSTGLTVGITEQSNSGTTADVGAADLMGGSGTTAYSDDFSDLSGWGYVQNSSASGNQLLLGGLGLVTRTQSLSGAFDVNFDVKLAAANNEVGFLVNGFNFSSLLQAGSEITDTATHSIKITFDGAGNAATYIDGSSTAADTASGMPTSITDFSFQNTYGASTTTISNFSISTGSGTPTNVSTTANASNLGSLNLSTLTSALEEVATLRAGNGASQSRLTFASEVLTTNRANLESASSRITDVDVAEESTQLARYNVLVQAGTSMLTQANQSTQSALRLLG